MQRSSRAATAAILLAASVASAWLLPAAAVRAEPSGGEKERIVQLQAAVCASLCVRRVKTCPAATPEPMCNAEYVGCIVESCQACVPAFGSCMAGFDTTPKACEQPFIACLKPRFAALKDKKPISFSGGDSATKAQAVVIVGARTEPEGIVSENLWVFRTHPTWRKQDQALLNDAGKVYDRIGYEAPDGKHDAWFDIMGFFGKM